MKKSSTEGFCRLRGTLLQHNTVCYPPADHYHGAENTSDSEDLDMDIDVTGMKMCLKIFYWRKVQKSKVRSLHASNQVCSQEINPGFEKKTHQDHSPKQRASLDPSNKCYSTKKFQDKNFWAKVYSVGPVSSWCGFYLQCYSGRSKGDALACIPQGSQFCDFDIKI